MPFNFVGWAFNGENETFLALPFQVFPVVLNRLFHRSAELNVRPPEGFPVLAAGIVVGGGYGPLSGEAHAMKGYRDYFGGGVCHLHGSNMDGIIRSTKLSNRNIYTFFIAYPLVIW